MRDEILPALHFSRGKRLRRRAEDLGLYLGEIFNVRVWEEKRNAGSINYHAWPWKPPSVTTSPELLILNQIIPVILGRGWRIWELKSL